MTSLLIGVTYMSFWGHSGLWISVITRLQVWLILRCWPCISQEWALATEFSRYITSSSVLLWVVSVSLARNVTWFSEWGKHWNPPSVIWYLVKPQLQCSSIDSVIWFSMSSTRLVIMSDDVHRRQFWTLLSLIWNSVPLVQGNLWEIHVLILGLYKTGQTSPYVFFNLPHCI